MRKDGEKRNGCCIMVAERKVRGRKAKKKFICFYKDLVIGEEFNRKTMEVT